jgi:hypothetical protein
MLHAPATTIRLGSGRAVASAKMVTLRPLTKVNRAELVTLESIATPPTGRRE